MPNPNEQLKALLDSAPTTDEVRYSAWEAFHNAQSRDQFVQSFDGIELPRETKRQLWFMKFPEAGKKAQAQPPTPTPVSAAAPPKQPTSVPTSEPPLLDRAIGYAKRGWEVAKETASRAVDAIGQGVAQGAAYEQVATPFQTPTEEQLEQVKRENAKTLEVSEKPVIPLRRLAPDKPQGKTEHFIAGALGRAEQYTTPPALAGAGVAAALLPVVSPAVAGTALAVGGVGAGVSSATSFYGAAQKLAAGDYDGAASLVGEGTTDAILAALLLRSSKTGATKAVEFIREKFPQAYGRVVESVKAGKPPQGVGAVNPEEPLLDQVLANMESGGVKPTASEPPPAPKTTAAGGGGTGPASGGKATNISSKQPVETGSPVAEPPQAPPATQAQASSKPTVELVLERPAASTQGRSGGGSSGDLLDAAVRNTEAAQNPLEAAVRATEQAGIAEPPKPVQFGTVPVPDEAAVQALVEAGDEVTPENVAAMKEAMEASDPRDFLMPESYRRFFGQPPTASPTSELLEWSRNEVGKRAGDSERPSSEPPRPISDVGAPTVPSSEARASQSGPAGATVQSVSQGQADLGSRTAEGQLSVEVPQGSASQPASPSPDRSPRVLTTKTKDLAVDPVRLQYKSNVGQGGVSDEMKDDEVEWNPDLAGVLAVWKDPADNKTYVVNGHHRYDKAVRKGVEDLDVRYIQAKDAKEARAIGALINIAEGRGTAVDAAKVFRDLDFDDATLKKRGIHLKGPIAKEAHALRDLTTEVFSKVVNEEIPSSVGAVIGKMIKQPEDQIAASDLIARATASGKRLTSSETEDLIKLAQNAPKKVVQDDNYNLFGNDEQTQNLALEQAVLADAMRKQLAAEKRLFSTVGREAAAEQLGKAGNKINTKDNARIAQEANQALEVYNKLYASAGSINRALEDGAVRIARGDNESAVRKDAYEAIRRAIAETFQRSDGADTGRGSSAVSGGSSESRPGTDAVRPSGNGTAQVAERPISDVAEPPKPPAPKPRKAKPAAEPKSAAEQLADIEAEIETWKAKVYKQSDKVVYTKGTQDVGGVTAINEGRRRKRIAELEAKASELRAELGIDEPPRFSLFDEENSLDLFSAADEEAARQANASHKAQTVGKQLTAEFNSPLTAGNRRKPLKKAPAPQQHSMFDEPPQAPQANNLFDLLGRDEGIKLLRSMRTSKPLDEMTPEDAVKEIKYKIYAEKNPFESGKASRIYANDPTIALLTWAARKAWGDLVQDFQGVFLIPMRLQQLADVLLDNVPTGLSPEAQAKVHELGQVLSDLRDTSTAAAIVRVGGESTMKEVKKTVRHEQTHASSDIMVRGTLFDEAKAPENFQGMHKKVVAALGRLGYTTVSSDTFYREAVAFIASGEFNRVGLSKEQAFDYLATILELTIAKHGPDNGKKILLNAQPSIRKEASKRAAATQARGDSTPEPPKAR